MKAIPAILFIILFTCVQAFPQMVRISGKTPTDMTAGKMTYQWEIKRMLLESSNTNIPRIVQGDMKLSANTIIFDDKNQIGYAYGNVYIENKKQGFVLTAGECNYFTAEKKMIARSNPVITSAKEGVKMTAEQMTFFIDQDLMILNGNAHIDGANYSMKGDAARFYQQSGKISLSGNTETKTKDSFFKADQVDIFTRNQQLDSYVARGNVVVINDKEKYTITSGKLEYYEARGFSRITENAVIDFEDKKIMADEIEITTKDQKLVSYKTKGNVRIINKKGDAENGYNITSGNMEFNDSEGYTRLKDNAHIESKDKDIHADEILIYQRDNIVERYVAIGNVIVSNKENDSIIRCGRMEYNEKSGYTKMTKNATADFADQIIYADNIELLTMSDKSVYGYFASGNVRVISKKDDSKINGDSLEYIERKGFTRITGNAHVIFEDKDIKGDKIEFTTRGGKLTKYFAKGNVVAVNPEENYTVYAGQIESDEKEGVTTLSRNARIEFPERTISAFTIQIISKFGVVVEYRAFDNVRVENRGQREDDQYTIYSEKLWYYPVEGLVKMKQRPTIEFTDKTLEADNATVRLKDNQLYKYTGIGHVKMKSRTKKNKIRMTAGRMDYWGAKEYIKIVDKPVVRIGENRIKAKLIEVYLQDQEIDRYVATGDVRVVNTNKKQQFTMTSQKMEYFDKQGLIRITKNPFVDFKDRTLKANEIQIRMVNGEMDTYSAIGKVKTVTKNTNKIETIIADRMDYNEKKGYGKLTGNPFVDLGDQTVSAQKIEVYMDAQQVTNYSAHGRAVVTNRDSRYIVSGEEMQHFDATGYTRISRNAKIDFQEHNIQIYADEMEQLEQLNKANMNGNVVVVQGERKAFSQWGVYDMKTEKLTMTGNPRFEEGKSVIYTQRIDVDVKNELIDMIGGTGPGYFDFRL